ncbi:MAG: Gfo/Idh/MocA family protein, partial [Armatimonadota bacterium]
MDVLRVGIVGAGGMGSTHARSFARLEGVAVTAVADTESGKAEALAHKYGANAFASHDALLGSGVDIVVVAVPTDLHRAIAEAAFSARCHVLVEKPLALDPVDADAIVAAADRAGRTLGVGQCVRFFPEYARAKKAVDSGEIGAPAAVRCRRGGGFPTWSPWFAEVERSGGVLFDLGVHEFDWLLWCFGPV